MFSRIYQAVILAVGIFVGIGLCESTGLAQGGTGGTGGIGGTGGGTGQVGTGGTGQVDGTTGGLINTGQTTGGQSTGSTSGSGSSNVSNSSQGVGDLGNAIELDDIVDNRNQGFVGATAARIQEFGFVGRPGELIAPPMADGSSFGGGVNDSTQSTINIGGGTTGGGNAGRGVTGFSAAGNGVTITRRSLRSAVRPSFSAPQMSGAQVSTRFGNHFVLQPGAQSQPGSYSIDIRDRTAFLNGSVSTLAESERLVRQLRLEPGVYKVVNQLQISK